MEKLQIVNKKKKIKVFLGNFRYANRKKNNLFLLFTGEHSAFSINVPLENAIIKWQNISMHLFAVDIMCMFVRFAFE